RYADRGSGSTNGECGGEDGKRDHGCGSARVRGLPRGVAQELLVPPVAPGRDVQRSGKTVLAAQKTPRSRTVSISMTGFCPGGNGPLLAVDNSLAQATMTQQSDNRAVAQLG